MKVFIIRRLIFVVIAVISSTLIVFALSRFSGGDPRSLMLNVGYASSPEIWEAWGERLHLDKPLVHQYFIWLWNLVVHQDFGLSLKTGQPANQMIMQFAPASIQLGFCAALFVFVTGIPLGVLSAVKRGSIWDIIARTFALFGQALPPFWLGIMLILLFAVNLDWLPAGTRGHGIDWPERLKFYVMPTVTLGWLASATVLRLVRSSMLEVLDSEFVKLARAKGVGSTAVVWKHAFRNALIPPLTVSVLILAGFISGAVVTEAVFSWPGLGFMVYQAVLNIDFPVVTAAVLALTLLTVSALFVLDILYAFIDPRIRYT